MSSASFFGGLSSAVSDIFGGIGDLSEAAAYGRAAGYAEQNAQIEKESTAIQEYQAGRRIVQTQGATQASGAAAGFKQTGSVLDVLHDSAAQGALTKNLIELQGAINVNGYMEQAASYRGMQGAAEAAAGGGIFGGILGAIGAVVGL